MTFATVLFGEEARWRAEDIAPIAASSAPGIIVALLIGAVAFFAANMKKLGLPDLPGMKFIDPLVLAIFLGMVVRLVVARTPVLPKLIPGMIMAPYLFVPFGIILYGAQLRFDQLAHVHPITLVWMLVTMAVTFAFIYLVGKRVFKFKNPFACLLAVGSAICGASAIAVVSPVVEADPDEMGTALITNTLLVIASFYTLAAVSSMIDPELFARAAGALLQQTGFVHMAVAKGPLQDLAMAIKTTRVGLLILIIPAIAYIVSRKIFIPWYMILFVAVGFWYSTTTIPASITDNIKLAYGLIFTTALASIGLNANIAVVVKRIGQPLILTYVAFLVSLVLFWACESLMH
jgi:uncharacterized integral membrane protein (TIGR00698 family)